MLRAFIGYPTVFLGVAALLLALLIFGVRVLLFSPILVLVVLSGILFYAGIRLVSREMVDADKNDVTRGHKETSVEATTKIEREQTTDKYAMILLTIISFFLLMHVI